MNIIKTSQLVATVAQLILVAIAFNIPVLAQDHRAHHAQAEKDFTVGKKGEVHFNVEVRAGNTLLKPGMYQVQHIVEGDDHVIIFKEMVMPAGYKMGNTPVGKEIARVKCKVEPVNKKVGNTKIALRTNAAGQKEIAEVQVAGEAFKHIL